MNQNKKIKLVWICHFSNNEVLEWIRPWFKRKEIAPWIPNLIKGFVGKNEIELHVISLHSGISIYKKHKKDGIFYYFVNYGVPFIGVPWQSFFPFDILTNYFQNKLIIKYLVNRIKPDVISLFGAENSNYSSTIIQFRKKYPVLIIIQGFISLGSNLNKLKEKKRVKVEQEILKKFSYFAGELDSKEYISNFNNHFKFYKLYGPVNEELVNKTEFFEYKYDLLFYGRVIKEKGIEDFIKIVGELSTIYPKISAIIIGNCSEKYLKIIEELINKLKCKNNIHFTGFLESQEIVFKHIRTAKIFLAPTYNDRLPLTIRECMMLKTAIIAYNTGGIPFINKENKNVELIDVGDTKAMKESVIKLLNDEYYRAKLIENAYNYAISEFSLEKNTNLLFNSYIDIISKTNNYEGTNYWS